jgi:hypothetical protein
MTVMAKHHLGMWTDTIRLLEDLANVYETNAEFAELKQKKDNLLVFARKNQLILAR